jgi:beta-glucosidase-like glycosyl hydrolase
LSAGRLFVEALRFDFESVSDLRRRIDSALRLDVGGFIFFTAQAEVAASLAEEILAAADRPVWLAADLERGAGQHLRGLTTFPPPGALAHHPEALEAVRTAARCTAIEARALGLNLALAPVLDLDVEARNPIVGTRSFGGAPAAVAAHGRAWIEACQDEGVAACAKHFPGHGRTTADSHAELPVVDASRETLQADLAPFRAVADEVACVMSAHVAYPALGAVGPATLERAILIDLLRSDMGFEGLVLTDALNMSGVRAHPEAEAPEVAALAAGCDLLLYPPDLAQAIAAVEKAADRSETVAARLAESLARSERTLAGFPPVDRPVLEAAVLPDRKAIEIAADCVTTVGGVPEWLHPDQPVRVATIWDDREDPARAPFGALFREALGMCGWNVLPPGPAEPAVPVIVLVASTPQAWKGTAGLTVTAGAALEGVLAAGRVYPVVFGHPRLLEGVGGPGLCAWATEPGMEPAAARRLDGLAREAVAVTEMES